MEYEVIRIPENNRIDTINAVSIRTNRLDFLQMLISDFKVFFL